MKTAERRKAILEVLQRDGKAYVSDLCEQFGATAVTIRSDLDALEKEELLSRVPGGATLSVQNLYHLDYLRRTRLHVEDKQRLAAAVAERVNDGETLMINSGSTMVYVARALRSRKRLRVVTDSIQVALELGDVQGFRVLLLGGEINTQYGFNYGADALEQLSRYMADCCILSIDGVHPDSGLTTYHAEEASLDRVMMERSRRTLIAADASKLLHESFSRVAPLQSDVTLVTNANAEPAALDALRLLLTVVTR